MFNIHLYSIRIQKPKKQILEKEEKSKSKTIKPKRNIISVDNVPYKKLGVFRVFQGPKIRSAKLSTKPFVEIQPDTFFIRMKHYQKDPIWAKRMVELTYAVSSLMSLNYDFDEILKYIEENVRRINGSNEYGRRKGIHSTGFNIKKNERGEEYYETYKKLFISKKGKNAKFKNSIHKIITPKTQDSSINPYTCDIKYYRVDDKHSFTEIRYGNNKKNSQMPDNLLLVKNEYEKLKRIKNPTKQDINKAAAKINWLIAQQCPYWRGNDSIANILTKAIYNSYGYKTSPIKAGKSFDFEAFYRDLEDYIEVYPSLFEIEPYKDI